MPLWSDTESDRGASLAGMEAEWGMRPAGTAGAVSLCGLGMAMPNDLYFYFFLIFFYCVQFQLYGEGLTCYGWGTPYVSRGSSREPAG